VDARVRTRSIQNVLEQVKLADEFGFDQVWAVEHPFLKNILTARRQRRIQLCNPVGAFVNEQVSTVNFLFCHEDDAEGSRIGRHMATTFNYLASQLVSAREAFLSRSYQSLGLLPQLRRHAVGPDSQGEGAEGLALGNPERILRLAGPRCPCERFYLCPCLVNSTCRAS
jgi:hypothetical protein